jgi:hypothetical protein
MSCSGLRYARELDDIRSELKNFGEVHCINSAVINDWRKYGIHMLDGIFGVVDFELESIYAQDKGSTSITLGCRNGCLINILCLKKSVKTFSFEFWSESKRFRAEMNDNFSAFRRTMCRFVDLMMDSKQDISSEETIKLMKILIGVEKSLKEGRKVLYEEIKL